MSKARLVITAVTVEKRPVSEVARSYGVARSWICTLLARYQADGQVAFEPRSPAAEILTVRDQTRRRRADHRAAQRARRAGPGRRAAHHRLAPWTTITRSARSLPAALSRFGDASEATEVHHGSEPDIPL
jgi:transposase-like protein